MVLPDKTGPALDAAWRRTVDRLLRLDRELAADRRARIERVAAYRGEDPGAVLDRYGAPMLAATLANAPPPANLFDRAMLDVHANAGCTADPVLIRSLRPLASRIASLSTRLLLAPVAGGLVASPVANASGVAAAVTTLVAVSAGIWGLDYAINRVDNAISRPAFEAGLRRIVRDAHASASVIVRADIAAAVCAALSDAAACADPMTVAGTTTKR